MHPLSNFKSSSVRAVFSDIDGTLTSDGKISASTYESLWALSHAGIAVIPVTGRPAGWCEMIARQWPVHGVIGENGAFFFRMSEGRMKRHFFTPRSDLKASRKKLALIREKVLKEVPGCKVASDQFSRLYDLAIDFSEDVKPLPREQVLKIVEIFESFGAHAKVSHIHVNGWFGNHDKGTACIHYALKVLGLKTQAQMQAACAYVGDSPNDEPLFKLFKNSFGVANVRDYEDMMKHLPAFISPSKEGAGFCEIAKKIISC